MYITPRVLIQQEFSQLPVYSEIPLPAFIIGPNYSLVRYNIPSEKSNTILGTLDGITLDNGNSYDPANDTRYDIPNIRVGGVVDPGYTKVYAESVEAKYFPLSSLDSLDKTSAVFVVGPTGNKYANKVRFTDVILKSINGFNRDASFSGRDVAVGDVIKITDNLGNSVKGKIKALEAARPADDEDGGFDYLASEIASVIASGTDGVVGNNSSTFTSVSASFVANEVIGKYITIENIEGTSGVFKILDCPDSNTLKLSSAIPEGEAGTGKDWYIGGVYNSVNNTPLQTESYGADVLSPGTTNNTVNVANVSTAYKGYASKGIFTDVYTVEVGTAGNLTSARFIVTSQNGAFSAKTNLSLSNVGALVLDDENNNNVVLVFSEKDGGTAAFEVGNSWTLSVDAPVTPVNPNTSGEYTGKVDMVYTLRVDRGGPFYDGTNASVCAKISITASDLDNATTVLPEEEGYFPVGSYGVSASFDAGSNNGGLIAGDVYYIPVATEKKGPVTIVEFSESFPEATLNLATSLTAELFLTQKSIQISPVRDLLESTENWFQEDSYITINSGITTYDSSLIAEGVAARLPIVSAKLFVEHRDLLSTHTISIESIRSISDIPNRLGTIHPDNPLAQGVNDALLNAQNEIVYFVGVASDDYEGYSEAIKLAEKHDKVYSFVPLTFDKTIQDLIVSHVNGYSTAEAGKWRIAWLGIPDTKFRYLYDLTEEGESYTGTITDDPSVSGTQYRLLTVNNATFIEDGVRAGDSVRLNFKLSPDGQTVFDEYFVQAVKTNTTLTLQKSLSQAIDIPVKIQVLRNYTKTERAENIADFAAGYNNRRVRCVFPDTYKYGGVTKQGYFAAAGLAGLRSGTVPHQGLTGTEFYGADDLTKVVLEFTQDDLNTMAEKGVWLLAQESVDAKSNAYVRHQLTSAATSLNTSEDSITTNVDSISYALKNTLAPYIGRYNINADNIAAVRAAIVAELTFRATNTYTIRAGNQLTSFTPLEDIIRLEQDETFKDRLVVEVRLNVPYPMNYINLTLIV
jgi:hypothetical protein